jgi:DsbC/DsbD-like thiol-disulfide interchange protein
MRHTFPIGLMLAGLVVVGVIARGAAGEEKPPPVRASFVADVKTIKPGRVFDVGVLLRIEPGWHVYWENPGDAGAPTRVALTAPPGVAVSALRYPLPQEFTQPGDIKGYGYEGEVMVVAQVSVPRDWPRGKAIALIADVSWLSCKDVCLPGKARLELSVRVGDEGENANSELFATWHARLPLRVEDGTVPFLVDGPVDDLNLRWVRGVTDVRVLPVPPGGVDVVSVAVDHQDRHTRVRPALRVLGGEKKPGAALGLLVTFTDDRGQRRGVRLNIPIRAPGA